MSIQWIIYASVLFLNAIVTCIVAIRLIRMPSAPGTRPLALMFFMLVIWSLGQAMSALAPTLEEKLFWARIKNIGVLLVPPLWLFTTVQYTRLDKWLNKYTGSLFFIVPLTSLVLIFSDRWLHYYYVSMRPYSESGGPLIIERGIWYFYSTAYAYLLHVVCIVLLTQRAIRYRNIFRRQSLALISAVLMPVFANLYYQFAPVYIPDFSTRIDLTAFSFTATASLLAFGVLGLRVFDLTPIERDTVMERIPEMVFTLDARHRVIDANAVALKWLGKTANEIIGKNSADAFSAWAQLNNYLLLTDEIHEVIQIPISAEQPRALEVTVSLLYDDLDNFQGRVVLIRDISDHARLKETLMLRLAAESKTLAANIDSVADEMIDLLSPNANAEFFKMVSDGLRNFHDFGALGQSSLAIYIGAVGNTHIKRGKDTQRILREAIESLRPDGTRPPADPFPRVWHNYIILHDAYLLGVTNREIMANLYVSEGTFNRTRRKAIQNAARWLIERKRKGRHKGS